MNIWRWPEEHSQLPRHYEKHTPPSPPVETPAHNRSLMLQEKPEKSSQTKNQTPRCSRVCRGSNPSTGRQSGPFPGGGGSSNNNKEAPPSVYMRTWPENISSPESWKCCRFINGIVHDVDIRRHPITCSHLRWWGLTETEKVMFYLQSSITSS